MSSWARNGSQKFSDWNFDHKPFLLRIPRACVISLLLSSVYSHHWDSFFSLLLYQVIKEGGWCLVWFLQEELTEWRSRSSGGWPVQIWHFYSCLKAPWQTTLNTNLPAHESPSAPQSRKLQGDTVSPGQREQLFLSISSNSPSPSNFNKPCLIIDWHVFPLTPGYYQTTSSCVSPQN